MGFFEPKMTEEERTRKIESDIEAITTYSPTSDSPKKLRNYLKKTFVNIKKLKDMERKIEYVERIRTNIVEAGYDIDEVKIPQI